MKKFSLLICSVVLFTSVAQLGADTIINNSGWDGSTNSGWLGSGQSLTVPNVDTTFKTMTFFADPAAAGQTFTFRLHDAFNGGTTLFSNSFSVVAGSNTVTVNTALTGGQLVWTHVDYNGYSGLSLHFNGSNGYGGGNSVFGPFGATSDFPTLDHRFIAVFGSAIPEPGSAGLIGLAVFGLSFVRRRK